jgi:hypothetical protein
MISGVGARHVSYSGMLFQTERYCQFRSTARDIGGGQQFRSMLACRPLGLVMMSRVAIVLVLLAASVDRLTAGPVSCQCYCGTVLRAPCGDDDCKRVCGWNGGGNNPGYTEPYDNGLSIALQNFQAQLDNLARQSEAARATQGLPAPASFDQLQQRLGEIYAGVGPELQNVYDGSWAAGLSAGRMAQKLRELPARIATLNSEHALLVQKTQEKVARAKRLDARIAELDRVGQAINKRREEIEGLIHASKTYAHRALWVAAPEGLLDAGLQEPPGTSGMSFQYPDPQPVGAIIPLAGPVAPEVEVSPRSEPVTLPPLSGSVDEQIAGLGKISDLFQSYRQEQQRWSNEAEANRPRVEALEADRDDAARRVRDQQDRLQQAEHDVAVAQSGRQAAGVNFEIRRSGFAKRAVEFVVVEEFKDKVLVPGLRAFLSANGRDPKSYYLGDHDIEAYYTGRKRLLVAAGRPVAAAIAFGEVQKKTLTMIEGELQTLQEAAALLAHGSPAEIQAYAEKIFSGLERDAVEIIQTAGPVGLPPPMDKIASWGLGLASVAQKDEE